MVQAKAGIFVPELSGLEPIPETQRHGSTAGVGWVWFSANMGLPGWYLGVLALVLGLAPVPALAAILIGNAIGSAALGALSTLGPATGSPSIPLTARVFGRRGNGLASAFNAISCLGWYGVNAVVGAQALASLLHIPYLPALVVIVLILTGVAWYGHDLVHALEHRAAYLLLAVYAALAVRLIVVHPTALASAAAHPGGVDAFLLVVTIIASFVFSWAPYAGDYSRYLPADTPRPAVFWSTAMGAFLACVFLQVLGLAAARAVGAAGTPAGILSAAMGPLAVPALAAVVLGTITANVLNVYTGALSTLSLGLRLPRTWMAVLFGVGGGAVSWIAAAHFSRNFEDYLLLISYWVAPWVGVVLAWSLVHPRLPVEGPTVRRRLLGAFVLGVVATVPFMNQALYVGPVAKWLGGADLGYWVAFAVAFGLGWNSLRASRSSGDTPTP